MGVMGGPVLGKGDPNLIAPSIQDLLFSGKIIERYVTYYPFLRIRKTKI